MGWMIAVVMLLAIGGVLGYYGGGTIEVRHN